MRMPHHETFKRNGRNWGRLLSEYTFYDTPIKGYDVYFDDGALRCHLKPNGDLTIAAISEWDYGTGPVVQDLGMIVASLFHDPMCKITDAGLIPYSERRRSDNYFTKLLWNIGTIGWKYPVASAWTILSTGWRTFFVNLNSQTKARWSRKR